MFPKKLSLTQLEGLMKYIGKENEFKFSLYRETPHEFLLMLKSASYDVIKKPTGIKIVVIYETELIHNRDGPGIGPVTKRVPGTSYACEKEINWI